MISTLDEGKAAFDRRDYATALRLWRPLAEQGNAKAQLNLGLMYATYADGRDVPHDPAEAVKWCRLAAEQGEKEAQYTLGFLYANEGIIPMDLPLAHMWYNLAASLYSVAKAERAASVAKGLEVISVSTPKLYSVSEAERAVLAAQVRDHIATLITPAQLAETQKLAREWKPK